MPSTWSITIDEQPDGTITFTPALPGAQAGQPLGANKGDNVTWDNRTNGAVTLTSVSPSGLYLTDPIPAGQVSDPAFNVKQAPGTTITYSSQPPQPQHSIVVVTPPAPVA